MEQGNTGIVVATEDPAQQGRVQLLLAQGGRVWARVVRPYFASDTINKPKVGDEVLVLFDGGNAQRPIVIGHLRNGADKD